MAVHTPTLHWLPPVYNRKPEQAVYSIYTTDLQLVRVLGPNTAFEH